MIRKPVRAVMVGALGLVTVGILVLAFLSFAWATADLNTAGRAPHSNELKIPPLAESTIDSDGRRVFDLRLQTGATDLGQERPTRTWGVNGPHLGPTLRAARGERVAVNITNDVGETTTLHWHGMHLPARMDGGPHQMIEPGRTFSPTWTIDQPAATLWYHPHLHGSTAQHVYRGLAGMFILDDPAESPGLPNRYGTDDVPVIVQDKSFTDDGQLDESSPMFSPTGPLGDTVVVNGTVLPHHKVSTQRVRLRLLNASSARIYNFGVAGDGDESREFAHIGTDGGLLPRPFSTDRVRLSPGERAEIVVDLNPGQNLMLRSHPSDLGTDPWNQRFVGGDDTLDVLELRAAKTLSPSTALPDQLAPAPGLDESDAVKTRTFELSGTRINGQKMDLDRIDEAVVVGDTEVWEVSNTGGTPHNFHVHDVQFQILSEDGDSPPAGRQGWKDTVYVTPGTKVRLLMRFTDYTDPDSPYMFHCHLLQHEDRGMMGQFVVVSPGQQTGNPSGDLSSHRH